MNRVVAILAIVVLSVGSAAVADANHTIAGQRLTHGEWSIPADHQYQVYNPTTSQYVSVPATQVLDQLIAGAWVYDRTDNHWLQHPNFGKNPLYLAATAPAQGTTAAAGGWQRIHGTVQSLSGSQFTLRADDGRMLTVDMTQVNPNVQRALTQNEGVEVTGHYASGDTNRILARWIQQDNSNPARGGRIVGSAPPAPAPSVASPPPAAPAGKVDEKAWQRIRGRVESVSGTTMRLRADDGRMIQVDMSKVAAGVQRGLTAGEPVTVIGHYDNDRLHVDAQFIQQERAGGAASPKTDDKPKHRK